MVAPAHGSLNPRCEEFHRLLDILPAAAYACDADGLITHCNLKAVDAWGRRPVLDDPADRF